jgi:hypothetical protein
VLTSLSDIMQDSHAANHAFSLIATTWDNRVGTGYNVELHFQVPDSDAANHDLRDP